MTNTAAPRTRALDECAAHVAGVAAQHADDVDVAGRFPAESLAALREAGAMSVLVPEQLGGAGAGVADVARACTTLGRACSATAMVFAMHQIQVATLVRHALGTPAFDAHLRDLVVGQRLIGSVTSEVSTGGDMSRSSAALLRDGADRASFEKQAPTVSYGAYADDLLTTLRRDPGADEGDQVLALTRAGEHTLAPTGVWDPLGMRGTCSPGFVVRADLPASQIVAAPFAAVSSETMVPISHLLWASLWTGIALDAFDRARAFVRAGARRSGSPGHAGQRLAHLAAQVGVLQAEVDSALQHFAVADATPDRAALGTMAAALRYNNLKISASEQAVAICTGALGVTGFAGYRNDSPFAVGRHVRDVLSAPVMVSNDRLRETNAQLLLVVKEMP